MFSKASGLEACDYHPHKYYTKACQQCQLPVCVECMEHLEHTRHSFYSIYELLSEKKTELYKSLQRCHSTRKQLLSRKTKLKTEVDKMQFMMISKYKTLQELLNEYLLQNNKKIESFWESQTDEIDSKVKDIDLYISNVNKTLREVSKCRPAQALIQLQSCSDTEDLFKNQRIVYPDIGIKETDLMKTINLFGNIPESMGVKTTKEEQLTSL